MASTAKRVYDIQVYITSIQVDEETEKVVELANLMYHLTGGKRGDKQLASLFRRRGYVMRLGTIPQDVKGLYMTPFPGQPGHAAHKPMTSASRVGLEWLLPEMDQEILEVNENFCKALLHELRPEPISTTCLQTRYPQVQMVADSTSKMQLIKRDDGPRFVLYTLLAAFAPGWSPGSLFHSGGLKAYLLACGVAMPSDVNITTSDLSVPDGPLLIQDNPIANAFTGSILPYERALAEKSCGLTWGYSCYNNGQRSLEGDLPIMVLVLFRLRTLQARQLQAGAFHQGLVLMGGNAEVAQAMAAHWQAEREAQPNNALLQFLGVAVDHEVNAVNGGNSASSSSGTVTTTDLNNLRDEIQTWMTDFGNKLAREVAQRMSTVTVVEMTRQSGGSALRDQELLMEIGHPIEDTEEFREQEEHLSTSNFVSSMLYPDQQYVVSHINGPFAKEVKKRKVEQCKDPTEFCWIYRQQAMWRIYYTERDRTMMEEVWELPSIKLALRRMLRVYQPNTVRQRRTVNSAPEGQRSIRNYFQRR